MLVIHTKVSHGTDEVVLFSYGCGNEPQENAGGTEEGPTEGARGPVDPGLSLLSLPGSYLLPQLLP